MMTANKVVRQAESYLGLNEKDGSFRVLIDMYNYHPLPRGVRATYNSEWCAIFVTCVGYATGTTKILGAECSVPKLMAWYKAQGVWLGANVTPKAGDIVIYDWDNVRDGDHIGIVECVKGNTVTAIEGNMAEKVDRRNFSKGWSRVTGYARPKYEDADAVFRNYNAKSGDHFFTTSATEAYDACNYGLYTGEGCAFYVAKEGQPVYRVYNPLTGEHFYTASAGEKNSLTRKGWKSEGVAFHSAGDKPVYRLYKNGGKHMFTTSMGERNNLLKLGWTDEGTGWYVLE